jgi:hypothetical protein
MQCSHLRYEPQGVENSDYELLDTGKSIVSSPHILRPGGLNCLERLLLSLFVIVPGPQIYSACSHMMP